MATARSYCIWANRLSKLIDKIQENPFENVEALGKVLKYATLCYGNFRPLVNQIKEFCSFETGLGHKYQELSYDLYGICQDVKVFSNIMELLRKMADDQDRIERLRAEFRCQEERGVTHFDSQNMKCFPELIDFKNELEKRIKDIKLLAEKIKEKKWKDFFANIKDAEDKAARMENRAWWMKTSARALVAACAVIATGGIAGAIVVIGAEVAALGVASAGIGGGYLSYKISGKSAQKEKEMRKNWERFELLRKEANKFTLDCSEVETLSYEMDATISRAHPQPLTKQLSKSLENVLTILKKIDCNLIKETKVQADWITDSIIKGN